jgi:hypothetical protein
MSRMPAVKNVGEPCAREPHARFDAAAGGIWCSVGNAVRVLAPPADPTAPARSYFCSPRKAGVSSRRSTSLSKIRLDRERGQGWRGWPLAHASESDVR